jgi:hypothetical protein
VIRLLGFGPYIDELFITVINPAGLHQASVFRPFPAAAVFSFSLKMSSISANKN